MTWLLSSFYFSSLFVRFVFLYHYCHYFDSSTTRFIMSFIVVVDVVVASVHLLVSCCCFSLFFFIISNNQFKCNILKHTCFSLMLNTVTAYRIELLYIMVARLIIYFFSASSFSSLYFLCRCRRSDILSNAFFFSLSRYQCKPDNNIIWFILCHAPYLFWPTSVLFFFIKF